MKIFLIPFVSIFFFSCQQKENKNVKVNPSNQIVSKKNKEENKQIGDTIFMNFKNEKGLLIAEGVVDSIHSKIYVKFKNEDPAVLKATIIPSTGKGNIRFNQIIFPDKNSDGPFGMDLEMVLKQKGNYILVIGHSLMADNPYWGKFKVQLEHKKG
ncbi:hypothetical protein [Flavobacterium sp.]|uniref:hypothetical protein n=1 Tax=Flavobacterium sp. TaxID=239 RepID=UPI003D09D8A0